MSHHPACHEQHIPSSSSAGKPLDWQPYNPHLDGTITTPLFKSCVRCTNTVYEAGGIGEVLVIIRTHTHDREPPVIFRPADQGSVLGLWFDLLNGTVH